MNKRFIILFILLCVVSILTACGNGEENEDCQLENTAIKEINLPSAGNSEEQQKEDAVTEEVSLPPGCINAVDYIQSLVKVEVYSEGKYVVMGTNNEKSNFCGVLYENGQLKVFDDYVRVYPLRDGRLLATTEEKPQDLSYENSHIQFATVNGVIIDENGNIIFSGDGYLRFIPVSDNRLLVFNASSGFEGAVFEFGVLDCDGNWIYELSQDNEIAQIFEDSVTFNSDSSWKFDDSASPKMYGRGTQNVYYKTDWQVIIKDIDSVQIFINRQIDPYVGTPPEDSFSCTFTYDAKTDDLIKGNFNYTFTNADNLIQSYRLLSDRNVLFIDSWVSVPNNYKMYSYEINTLTGEKKKEISGFYIDNDYYFDSNDNMIKNIVNGQTVEVPDSVYNHLRNIYMCQNMFYAIMCGDDNQYYIQKLGIDQNPLQLEYYEYESVDNTIFFGSVFVYCNEHEHKAYIVDSSTFEITKEIEIGLEGPSFNLYKLDEKTFAIRGYYSGRSGENYLVYNLDGELVY